MRTTLDLPDSLPRQLKSRVAREGTTLNQLIQEAFGHGLSMPVAPEGTKHQRSTPPSLVLGRPLRAKHFSDAALADMLGE